MTEINFIPHKLPILTKNIKEETMHEGCSGSFESGKQVVDKLRMMGFSEGMMPLPLHISCDNCGQEFEMYTFEAKCECGMVYGVTPCHAFSAEHVQAAGVEY